jgi:hypothetical protein
MQAGLSEIQKNIAILTTLTEPLQIVDKRRKQIIATVYPRLVTHSAQRLAGKYRERIPAALLAAPFEDAREAALLAVMREKYGVAD